MPATFLVQPQDLLLWALVGVVGGMLGGLVVRGGSSKPTDLLLGAVAGFCGGVATEFIGMREAGEAVASIAVALFTALFVTAVVRLLPGRFSA
jgi:uncharacterized membrane protein YeaQ/YmgE (transglycosylase-associated protein family)